MELNDFSLMFGRKYFKVGIIVGEVWLRKKFLEYFMWG